MSSSSSEIAGTAKPRGGLWMSVRANLGYLAWAQALIATSGSLFFSEVLGFLPCILCWYQRIFMYPLVFIIGAGVLLRDHRARYYVLPLSMLGWIIATYHTLLYYGVIPEEFHICTSGVPCETRWIEWLGFVGMPTLSFIAFTVITLAMLWYQPTDNDDTPAEGILPAQPGVLRITVSTVIAIAFVVVITAGVVSRAVPSTPPADSFGPVSSNAATPEVSETQSLDLPASVNPELVVLGQQIFSRQCSACHGQNVLGLPSLGLPLAYSQFVKDRTDAELLEFIMTGRDPNDPASQTGVIMPGKGGNPALSEDEILAVIGYLRLLNP